MVNVSILSHYYNNSSMVTRFCQFLKTLSSVGGNSFECVLVDDASRESVNTALFDGIPRLRVFRVTEDIPWNQPGARNLAAMVADGNVLFFLDIDHIVINNTLGALTETIEKVGARERLLFHRTSISAGEYKEIKSHLNSFAIRRDEFNRIGGYDERFSGSYGCDDKYFIWRAVKIGIVDRLVDITLEVDVGGKTTGLDRSVEANRELYAQLTLGADMVPTVRRNLAFEQIY